MQTLVYNTNVLFALFQCDLFLYCFRRVRYDISRAIRRLFFFFVQLVENSLTATKIILCQRVSLNSIMYGTRAYSVQYGNARDSVSVAYLIYNYTLVRLGLCCIFNYFIVNKLVAT